ncbi:hypothetical protein FOCC_FOCC001667 [Frankliniella occidentalis]|nr:hypothetical protein FOCC_FOCC001667 [Frankliniella occidentalis]
MNSSHPSKKTWDAVNKHKLATMPQRPDEFWIVPIYLKTTSQGMIRAGCKDHRRRRSRRDTRKRSRKMYVAEVSISNCEEERREASTGRQQPEQREKTHESIIRHILAEFVLYVDETTIAIPGKILEEIAEKAINVLTKVENFSRL